MAEIWSGRQALAPVHSSKSEAVMIITERTILRTCACAALALWAASAAAQSAAPSQSEIAGQLLPKSLLTTRGLPVAGSAPKMQPNPAMVPTSAPAQPRQQPMEHTSRTAPRPTAAKTASVAPTAPVAAHPQVTLNTILFEFNSDQLRPESIETLKNLGNALNQELKDQKVFLIEGHTDAVGAKSYNIDLSKRRAEAVKNYLVKEMGVAADRLETVGKGASDLAVPKKPYAAQNRRVVIVNEGA
jgi:OOP family OmpA-OmpF porin